MKELSRKLMDVPNSAIRKIFDMCAGIDDLVKFTLGEPDFATAPNIIEAANKAMLRGETKYTSNRGIPELREAISRKARLKKGVILNPDTEIIVTNGGMQALYMSINAICNPGDEIIVGAPYFTNYLGQILMSGAVPKIVPLREKNGFIFDIEELKAAVTEKTKAILLNSPSNPLGSVTDKSTMEKIAALAIEYDLYVIADEVYQDYIYDSDVEFCSIASLDGMKERTVIVDSFSKAYAMTGWRIGWAGAPSGIINLMVKQMEGIASCVNSCAQYGALEALEGSQDLFENMIQAFKNRRNLLYERISKIDKLSCGIPQGAFYLFINITKTGLSSDEFAIRLLKEQKVGLIPGSGFGEEGEGYVRISYVVSEKDIIKGTDRIKKFVESL